MTDQTAKPHTEIGCEAVIHRDKKILLGKRKNCYGAGTWAFPGGHLEFGERLVDCICREMSEEIGAHLTPEDFGEPVSIVDGSIDDDKNKHHVHVSFAYAAPNGFEPKLMEPDLCEEWRWFDVHELPLDNFFGAHRGILDNYLAKRLYAF